MLDKLLGVFIIAGIYSALSLFIENLIKKLFHVKECKMDKNVSDFCVYAIKIVRSHITVLLLCVCSVMIKRVKIVYTVFRAVCSGNELIR